MKIPPQETKRRRNRTDDDANRSIYVRDKKNKTKILTYNAHPPPPRVILETKESNGFTDERRKRRKKKRERNVDDSPYWSTIRLMVISIDPGRGHSAGPFKASPPVPAEGPKVRYFCGFWD